MTENLRNRSAVCCILSIVLPVICIYGGLEFILSGPRPPAAVIDIDSTIFMTRSKKPIKGASETLRWLDNYGINIIYLTGRPAHRSSKTRKWLQYHDFPRGSHLILNEDINESSLNYKIRKIGELQRDYTIVFGVGDKNNDFHAYQKCGVVAIPAQIGWDEIREVMRNILEVERIIIEGGSGKIEKISN